MVRHFVRHPVVVFLTAFSIRVSILSSKIHNGDDTPKDWISLCWMWPVCWGGKY